MGGIQSHKKRRCCSRRESPKLQFFFSHLHHLNLPFDSSASHWTSFISWLSIWHYDPIDTPDGGNVGLHKHLTIASKVTTHIDPKFMLQWITNNCVVYFVNHTSNKLLHTKTKLFINGNWIGVIEDPMNLKEKFLSARRIGMMPYFVSFAFIIQENTIEIYTDGGRLIRPVFYTKKEKSSPNSNMYSLRLKTILSYEANRSMMNNLIQDKDEYSWFDCITGFVKKKTVIDPLHVLDYSKLFFDNISDLYSDAEIHQLETRQGILDYLDSSESETIMLCSKIENYRNDKSYTHVDIDASFLLDYEQSSCLSRT